MAISKRTISIIGSSVIAVALVVGAYVFSGPNAIHFNLNSANAGTTEELLKAYTAKDTDGDGLPDWQEALYGTDPNKADTNGDGISDGDAVKKGLLSPTSLSQALATSTSISGKDIPGKTAAPDSLTDQFSKSFFQEYINAGGAQGLSADQEQALINQLLVEFTAKAQVAFESKYTISSIHISSSATIPTYAATVEKSFRSHDVKAGNADPLDLMSALLEKQDESARPKLKTLSAAYAAIASDLATTTVPPLLANQHLTLLRSYDELARATAAVASYEKDPIAVLGSLSIYGPASSDIVTAVDGISDAILTTSGEPTKGGPGELLVSFSRMMQASTTTP